MVSCGDHADDNDLDFADMYDCCKHFTLRCPSCEAVPLAPSRNQLLTKASALPDTGPLTLNPPHLILVEHQDMIGFLSLSWAMSLARQVPGELWFIFEIMAQR